ncbi:MAG: hypothetical protein M3Q50_10485 [Chloroflexota bacterium]|nr:hypothetical protein [Chloroflexota bacterium]
MNEKIRYESIQEPRDDEERELMNPGNWDWEHPIEGVTVQEPSVTIRFTRQEYMALWRSAPAQGLSTMEFTKQAALALRPQEASR